MSVSGDHRQSERKGSKMKAEGHLKNRDKSRQMSQIMKDLKNKFRESMEEARGRDSKGQNRGGVGGGVCVCVRTYSNQ